jgi:hypothetical protein
VDVQAYTDGVAARLTAAGWRIRERQTSGLSATRDGLVLRFDDFYSGSASPESNGELWVDVNAAEPRGASTAALAGGVLGLVLGWLLTGWASRRTEHSRYATRDLVVYTVVSMALLTPAWVIGVDKIITDVADGHYVDGYTAYGDGPFWAGLAAYDLLGALVIPAAIAAAIALLVAVRAPRVHGPATSAA